MKNLYLLTWGLCLAAVMVIFAMPRASYGEEAEVVVSKIAPLPVLKPKLGLTIGTRYEYNADDHTQNKMRIFAKQRIGYDQSLGIAWTRRVGETVNFFRNSTIEGIDYNNTGNIFIEYQKRF